MVTPFASTIIQAVMRFPSPRSTFGTRNHRRRLLSVPFSGRSSEGDPVVAEALASSDPSSATPPTKRPRPSRGLP